MMLTSTFRTLLLFIFFTVQHYKSNLLLPLQLSTQLQLLFLYLQSGFMFTVFTSVMYLSWLTHYLVCSLTHSLAYSLTLLLAHSLSRSLAHTLIPLTFVKLQCIKCHISKLILMLYLLSWRDQLRASPESRDDDLHEQCLTSGVSCGDRGVKMTDHSLKYTCKSNLMWIIASD